MSSSNMYTIEISPPENKRELFGAWCEELKLSAFGETEQEAFYNLIENIPIYFEIQSEEKRSERLREHRPSSRKKKFTIPAFA